MIHRTSFPAMGTTCEVTINGGDPALLDDARIRVEELERRWSRFRADSEISRLNARAGQPTALSNDAYLLVERAVRAWRWTAGLYDPTVLRAVEATGYDRSFDRIDTRAAPRPAQAAPGCSEIFLNAELRAVTLPPGTGFDPGGIGKGLAADLVVDLMLASGARGACVNLGGDGRVRGEPPDDAWTVGVADPHHDGHRLVALRLADHGVATSSRLLRRWTAGGVRVHHLVDPRSGSPVDGGIDAVTVIDRESWFAEILSKAVFIAGPVDGAALLARSGGSAVVVHAGGSVALLGPLADTLRPAA